MYTAPLHIRKRFLKVHISKELRKRLGTNKRTILVRKGDKVRVRTGKHKGFEGSVMDVDYKKVVLYIEGLSRTNARGQEKPIPIHPSNVELVDGTFDDDRMNILKR